VGREVSLAPDLAAESVSDLLELFSILPRIDDFPALAEPRGSGQLLHFHATDPGLGVAGEWLAHRTPSGVEWEHGHARADAALQGTLQARPHASSRCRRSPHERNTAAPETRSHATSSG
jgi:hypothetical protein